MGSKASRTWRGSNNKHSNQDRLQMNRKLAALLWGLSAAAANAAGAAEIDAVMDLQLRCGAGYLLIADNPEMNNTKEEAASFEEMGNLLLSEADRVLTEQGASRSEREAIGARYMVEMKVALDGDELGFDPEQCPKLAAEAQTTSKAAELDAEIDKHMTCGVGFLAAARVKEEEGEAETAVDLEALGEKLSSIGDDLMVEAGYSEKARYQIGRLYGESVGAKFNAGKELGYDWETCAALGF